MDGGAEATASAPKHLRIIKQQQIIPACRNLPQFLRKPITPEQREPGLLLLPLPADGLGLFLQVPEDTDTHGLLPILALAQDQIIALSVQGGDVDLGVGIPISAQHGEVKRPCTLGIQLPHSLPADILVDEGSVVLHETVADLVQDDVAVAAFDEAAVGIDEGKPEADIVILDPVQAPLALFGVLLGDGDFPLQDVQVDQGLEVLCQDRSLCLQDGCDGGQLTVAGGDGPDHGEVAAHLADLLLEQEMGFVVQIPRPVQHTALDGIVDAAAFGKQLDILGNAAGNGVYLNQLPAALAGEELVVVGKGDLLQPDLGCSSAVQRAAVGQCRVFHHGNQRAAQYNHHGLFSGFPHSSSGTQRERQGWTC